MEFLGGFAQGFEVALSPLNLTLAAFGAFAGTLVGALPGLGPANGVAILVPLAFTLGLPPESALILLAAIKGHLRWELSSLSPAAWFFGLTGLVFGFWYLHWVHSPIMLNALLYSPLGIINCPTMLAISGFLCLSSQRPVLLDFTSGLVCVYFGLFGIFFLGAYVDVALLACGCYQLARVAGVMRHKRAALV